MTLVQKLSGLFPFQPVAMAWPVPSTYVPIGCGLSLEARTRWVWGSCGLPVTSVAARRSWACFERWTFWCAWATLSPDQPWISPFHGNFHGKNGDQLWELMGVGGSLVKSGLMVPTPTPTCLRCFGRMNHKQASMTFIHPLIDYWHFWTIHQHFSIYELWIINQHDSRSIYQPTMNHQIFNHQISPCYVIH